MKNLLEKKLEKRLGKMAKLVGMSIGEIDVLIGKLDLALQTITDDKKAKFIEVIEAVGQFNDDKSIPYEIHHFLTFNYGKIEIESFHKNDHITTIIDFMNGEFVVNGEENHGDSVVILMNNIEQELLG